MSNERQEKKTKLNTDELPIIHSSASVSETGLNTKSSFNLSEIKEGVSKLIATRSEIKKALNPQVYNDVEKTINTTIESLVEIDDLIPFQQQIHNQIIEPVNNKISKSSTISLITSLVFGIIGIFSLVLSITQTQKSDQILSDAIAAKDSTIKSQASSIASIKDETEALIYIEDVGLTISILRKYLDCETIIKSYSYVEQHEIVQSAQQKLEDELSPYKRVHESELRTYSIDPLTGIRNPPKTIMIHPYQLEATAKILKTYFNFDEIKNALGDCQ